CTLKGNGAIEAITAYTGGSVLLPCSCTDLHTKPETFTWNKTTNGHNWVQISPESDQYKERFQLVNDHSSGNLSLLITHLTVEDGGVYRCDVKRDEYRDLKLTVKGCTLNQQTVDVNGDEGQSVLLPCSCSELQAKPHTFTWRFLRGSYPEIFPADQTHRYTDRVQLINDRPPGNLSLLISHLTVEDGGWYRCEINNYISKDIRLTVKGKGRELADMMERRKVDILYVQETRWKGSKARSIGAGFKLFYYGVDSKRNGVGVVLKEEFVRNVLEVKRVSDRVMSLKLEIEEVILNVVSGYAPQVGCELEEKDRFWSELDEVMENIPTGEKMVIGVDFNGHVGEGNRGDEEVMGKFGVKERNLEGQMVVDVAKRMDIPFQKREEHRVTYKSGGRSTQVVLPDDWETTAEVIRETGRKVLGVSSGRRKEDKETWWWNEEVQDSIQRKRLKREVSKAKQKAYDELYTRLDTREGEKDLYRLARQRDRDGKDVQQVRVIKDRDGRVLTSEESVQRRWKEYFDEMMKEENEREKRVEGVNSVEQKVDKIRKDEVRKALKRMKSGKAVGPDDIPVEVWKCLGEAAVEFLTSLFNRVLESERRPEEWRRSVSVPIFKNKGDVQSCSNYKGIKLMSRTMKLCERVVEARLRKVVEICEQQYGFMPRKSTTDAIFALRILMEKYRDGQRELHCVFVDLEKACDRVPREELWYCMRKSGVAEKYVRVVQDMYERSRTVVRCAVGQTEEFKVEVGLHQGLALSPFLFAIVMDQLSELVRQESPWTMMFADDIVICSESREQVEENLERWRFALERRGMKVSRSKTEYMCVNEREGSGTVRLQGEEVKEVQEFKYLGSTVQSNGEYGKVVKKRVQAEPTAEEEPVGEEEDVPGHVETEWSSGESTNTGCTLKGNKETEEITAHTGGSVLLPCSCTDLHTKPETFTWKRNTNGHNWVQISPESDQYKERFQLVNDHSSGNLSLLITHLTVEDGGVYRCNVKGDEYRDLRLTVKGCTLNQQTVDVTGNEGQSVLLPCSCSELQAKPHTFTWIFYKGSHHTKIFPADQTHRYTDRVQLINDRPPGNLSLLISHLTVEDGGWYRCEISEMKTFIYLTVKDPLPYIPIAVVTVIFLHILVALVYCTTIKKGPGTVHYSRGDGDGTQFQVLSAQYIFL
ncbi:hypothetical protein QTP70_001796, partial [Hemibagrus guttatus]